MALLDPLFSDDPAAQAELQMIAGLLGGRGNLGGILGRSLAEAQAAYSAAAQTKEARRMGEEKLRLERAQLDLAGRPQPFTLGVGQIRFGADGQPIAQGPKPADEAKPTALGQLIAEREKYPPGHPLRAYYDDAIKKQTTHASPVALQLPTPVTYIQGIGPSGKPEYFQAPTRAGEKPTPTGIQVALSDERLKPVPPTVDAAIRENVVALDKIDRALAAVKERPQAFGLQNFVPDVVTQRFDPGGVEARALIADIGSLKIHDRSGAAVTAAEFPRLRPFIPQETDSPQTITKKLQLFRKEYEKVLAEMKEAYTEEQGYRPPPALQRPFDQPSGGGDGWVIRRKQ